MKKIRKILIISLFLSGCEFNLFNSSISTSSKSNTNSATSISSLISSSSNSSTYNLRNATTNTNTEYNKHRKWIDCPLCTCNGDSTSPNYIFGSSFFNGDFSNMSDEESLIYRYMKGMEFDISSAIELMKKFRNLSEENQFYFIPIYIDIVDDLIVKIK